MPVRMYIVAVCLLVILLSACNQPFDPRAPLKQQMVVFSILSTDRNEQFVRVNLNYMPSGFDPSTYVDDNTVTDALVRIEGSGTTYFLRDTVLSRPDTSRYRSPLQMYVLSPFVPQNGRSYTIVVQSSLFGSASATVVVPGRASLSLSALGGSALSNPMSHRQETPILVQARISDVTQGYITRFFIDYEVLKGTEWVEERVEVPLDSPNRDAYSLEWARYPVLTRRSTSNQASTVYLNGYYRAVILDLTLRKYPSQKLICKWVVIQLLQTERNLYNYYSVVRGYRDPQSMRLDEPSYSNVSGGTGLVGAYALDSLIHILPEHFYGNR